MKGSIHKKRNPSDINKSYMKTRNIKEKSELVEIDQNRKWGILRVFSDQIKTKFEWNLSK